MLEIEQLEKTDIFCFYYIFITFLWVGDPMSESPEIVKCKQRLERDEKITYVAIWKKSTSGNGHSKGMHSEGGRNILGVF